MGTFSVFYGKFIDKSISDLDLQKALLKAGHANVQYSAKIKVRSIDDFIKLNLSIGVLKSIRQLKQIEKKIVKLGGRNGNVTIPAKRKKAKIFEI